MTNKQLYKTLLELAKQGNCFNEEVRKVLFTFKNSGRTQNIAIEILKKIKIEPPANQTLQNEADDILDMVTGYCNATMRVWEQIK